MREEQCLLCVECCQHCSVGKRWGMWYQSRETEHRDRRGGEGPEVWVLSCPPERGFMSDVFQVTLRQYVSDRWTQRLDQNGCQTWTRLKNVDVAFLDYNLLRDILKCVTAPVPPTPVSPSMGVVKKRRICLRRHFWHYLVSEWDSWKEKYKPDIKVNNKITSWHRSWWALLFRFSPNYNIIFPVKGDDAALCAVWSFPFQCEGVVFKIFVVFSWDKK